MASNIQRCRSDSEAVEPVVVCNRRVVFFMLLLGIMDFGRMLFRWNAAAEATRWGRGLPSSATSSRQIRSGQDEASCLS